MRAEIFHVGSGTHSSRKFSNVRRVRGRGKWNFYLSKSVVLIAHIRHLQPVVARDSAIDVMLEYPRWIIENLKLEYAKYPNVSHSL